MRAVLFTLAVALLPVSAMGQGNDLRLAVIDQIRAMGCSLDQVASVALPDRLGVTMDDLTPVALDLVLDGLLSLGLDGAREIALPAALCDPAGTDLGAALIAQFRLHGCALTGDQGWVDAMVKTYEQRKDVVMAGLRKIDRIQCVEPGGAFYAFPDMSAWIGKKLPNGTPITDASVLVEHLLVAHDVATVPGGPFGMQNHLRLSFTTDIASLEKALGRMKVAFDAL